MTPLRVKGYPHSGTHYVANLLRANVCCEVQDHDRHELSLSEYDWEIPPHVVVYKNPYDLIWGMILRRRRVKRQVGEEVGEAEELQIAKDNLQRWDLMHQAWLGYRELKPELFYIVAYEDVLRDERGFLAQVGERFDIEMSGFKPSEPSHTYGGDSKFRGKDYFIERRYMKEMPRRIRDFIDRYETPVREELHI